MLGSPMPRCCLATLKPLNRCPGVIVLHISIEILAVNVFGVVIQGGAKDRQERIVPVAICFLTHSLPEPIYTAGCNFIIEGGALGLLVGIGP